MSPEEKAAGEVPAPGKLAPPIRKRAPTLYAIIWFKLLKGVFCLLVMVFFYNEANKDLPLEYRNFLRAPAVTFILDKMRFHPENKFFTSLAVKVGELTDAKMHHAAWGAFLLSLFPLTEGIGLLFRVRWAGWLAIGESAFFVPIELYTLVNRPNFSWFILAVTVTNIIIVWYLYANRAVLFRHHESPSES